MLNIITNSGPGMISTGTGSGIAHRKAPFGHITLGGKAGEVIRFAASDLFLKFDQVFQGISVQTLGGSISVALTLADIDLAMNPIQDGSIWVNSVTINPGTITKLSLIPTAVKITFVADALVYLTGV